MPPITLDEPQGPRVPVMKRQRIGDTVTGAVVRTVQRDVLKDGQPALKDNGKPRQELVVTIVVLPGTTMPAGIGAPSCVLRASINVALISIITVQPSAEYGRV